MSELLTQCLTCGKEIAKSVESCPHCGAKQKKKAGWGKKILYGIGGFILLMGIIGALSGNDKSTPSSPPTSQQKTTKASIEPAKTQTQPTLAPKQETYNWNKKELDVEKNGNIPIAIRKMKVDGNLRDKSQIVSAGDVLKRPWDYYGKVIAFSGEVGIVQDYPPGTDISKALGGSAAEIVIVTNDNTIVDAVISSSSGSTKVGQRVTVYGYPVGLAEVQNKMGGKTTQLFVVGQL